MVGQLAYQFDSINLAAEAAITQGVPCIGFDQVPGAIRKLAGSSSNLVFIPPIEKRSLAGMLTFRQAQVCLQEGTITGVPSLDEHGNWVVTIERPSQQFVAKVRVVILCANGVPSRLVVIYRVLAVDV